MEAVWAALLVLPLAGPGADTLPSSLGKRIEEFELRDAAGMAHKLSAWADGRVVVVAFLGTECPLARLYAARLNELAEEFAARGVAFVGIDANQQDSAAQIAAYVKNQSLHFCVLTD